MTPTEKAAARRHLLKTKTIDEITQEEAILRMRYPLHTIEEAREIEACCEHPPQSGYVSGFDKLMAQERGRNISGYHT
jgi:hypothetical protein